MNPITCKLLAHLDCLTVYECGDRGSDLLPGSLVEAAGKCLCKLCRTGVVTRDPWETITERRPPAPLRLADSRPQNSLPVATTPASRFTMSNPYYQQYQQQQQQQQQQSHDANPYHQPYQGPMYPISGSSSGHTAPVPANAYEYDVGILAQQSVYVPGAMIDKRGGAGGKLAKGGKRTTVLRKGAGTVYEDQTLLEWNPGENGAKLNCLGVMLTVCLAWFRLFVGDLSNDVSDDVLSNAFSKYTSFTKARVIRDRLSGKVRLLPAPL